MCDHCKPPCHPSPPPYLPSPPSLLPFPLRPDFFATPRSQMFLWVKIPNKWHANSINGLLGFLFERTVTSECEPICFHNKRSAAVVTMDVFRDLHPPGTLGPMLYRAGCPIFCPIQIAKTIESQKGISSKIQQLMNNFSRRIHGRVLGRKKLWFGILWGWESTLQKCQFYWGLYPGPCILRNKNHVGSSITVFDECSPYQHRKKVEKTNHVKPLKVIKSLTILNFETYGNTSHSRSTTTNKTIRKIFNRTMLWYVTPPKNTCKWKLTKVLVAETQ